MSLYVNPWISNYDPYQWSPNVHPILDPIKVKIGDTEYNTIPNVLIKNKIVQTPFGPIIEQTPEYVNTFPSMYSTGLENNYFAQKDMTKYLLYRILDYWLYDDYLCDVLKYLKYQDKTVSVIKSREEARKNTVCTDTTEIIEDKADFIHQNYLDMDKMRHILKKIVNETGLRWYQLADQQRVVVAYVERYLKKVLKNQLEYANISIDDIKKSNEEEDKKDAEYMKKLEELRELEKSRRK